MKLNQIMLFAMLYLPLNLWAIGEAKETEVQTPVDHSKELTKAEQQQLEASLKNRALKHYAEGDFTGIRTSNYIDRTNALKDNDIKRYLIDLHSNPTSLSEKLAQLSKDRLNDLQTRLNARIKEETEENWRSSKGLRKDLEGLHKHVSNLIEILTEEPKSLNEAYKKLDFIQKKLSYYKSIKEKIVEINKDLEKNPKKQNLLYQKETLEEQLNKGKRLEQLSKTLEEKLNKYIESQPMQAHLTFAETELKNLEATDPEFFEKLNDTHPTTIQQLIIIKLNRPDLFQSKSLLDVLNEEIDVMKSQLPELKNPKEIEWYKLKIKIYEIEYPLLQTKLNKLEPELEKIENEYSQELKDAPFLQSNNDKTLDWWLKLYNMKVNTENSLIENNRIKINNSSDETEKEILEENVKEKEAIIAKTKIYIEYIKIMQQL